MPFRRASLDVAECTELPRPLGVGADDHVARTEAAGKPTALLAPAGEHGAQRGRLRRPCIDQVVRLPGIVDEIEEMFVVVLDDVGEPAATDALVYSAGPALIVLADHGLSIRRVRLPRELRAE